MIIQTISIKSVTAQGMGTLSVFEGSHDVPFDIKRIYYIHGAPKGTHRGGHAHKALRQVLWCPYGSILIRLDDGHEKSEVLLNDPAKGLIVVAGDDLAAGKLCALCCRGFLLRGRGLYPGL